MEYTETTRRALVDAAVELFSARGYAGTSLDEVVKRARVTKGALYHHFAGKQALFLAAFEAVEREVVERLAQVNGEEPSDPWSVAKARLHAFLRVCLEPAYQQIVTLDGPAVMGWKEHRSAEERHTFGIIRQTIGALIDSGEITAMPLGALSTVVFGALSAGATAIAGSPEPEQTSAEVGHCVERLLEGLRRGADESDPG